MNTNQQTENWTQRYVDYDKEEPQPRDISNDYIKEEMVGNVRGVFIKTRNLEPNEVENSSMQSSNAGSTQNNSGSSFQGSGSSGNVSGWSSIGDNKGFSGLSGSSGLTGTSGLSGGDNKGMSGLSTGSDKGFSGAQDQTSFGQISSDRSSLSQPGNWSDKNVSDMPPRSDVSQKSFGDTSLGKDNFGQGGNIGTSLNQQSLTSSSDQRTGLSGSLTNDVNKNIAGAASNEKNLVK